MYKKRRPYQSFIDPVVYEFILKIFKHFKSESATVKFKEQFFGSLYDPLYPKGEIQFVIEGLPDFPFILKIQIKTGYLQLKIYFAHKTTRYDEIELRYIKSLEKNFKGTWFYCLNHMEERKLNPMEGLDLFIQKFEQNFKVFHEVHSVHYI